MPGVLPLSSHTFLWHIITHTDNFFFFAHIMSLILIFVFMCLCIFTFGPKSLVLSMVVYVLLCNIYICTNKLVSSAYTGGWFLSFICRLSWISFTFLIGLFQPLVTNHIKKYFLWNKYFINKNLCIEKLWHGQGNLQWSFLSSMFYYQLTGHHLRWLGLLILTLRCRY